MSRPSSVIPATQDVSAYLELGDGYVLHSMRTRSMNDAISVTPLFKPVVRSDKLVRDKTSGHIVPPIRQRDDGCAQVSFHFVLVQRESGAGLSGHLTAVQ